MRLVARWIIVALSIVALASFAPLARAETGDFAVAPDDCVIAPVTSVQPGEAGDLTAPSPTPTPISIEDGSTVDPDVAQAVTGRIAMAIACQNAGDPLRMLANFSDRWVAERFSGYDLVFFQRFVEASGDPEPLPVEQRIELLSVEQVLARPDRSVVATVMTRVEDEVQTSLVVLVEESGAWLIDGGAIDSVTIND